MLVHLSAHGLCGTTHEHTLTLHHNDTGVLLYSAQGHKSHIESLQFDATGTCLVTASLDGTARIWRIKNTIPCTLAQALLIKGIATVYNKPTVLSPALLEKAFITLQEPKEYSAFLACRMSIPLLLTVRDSLPGNACGFQLLFNAYLIEMWRTKKTSFFSKEPPPKIIQSFKDMVAPYLRDNDIKPTDGVNGQILYDLAKKLEIYNNFYVLTEYSYKSLLPVIKDMLLNAQEDPFCIYNACICHDKKTDQSHGFLIAIIQKEGALRFYIFDNPFPHPKAYKETLIKYLYALYDNLWEIVVTRNTALPDLVEKLDPAWDHVLYSLVKNNMHHQ